MDSDSRKQAKELLSKLSDSEKWELILEIINQYPWYQLVSGEEEIKQGDILEDCPVFQLPEDLAEITKDKNITAKVEWRTQDVIIMSQSCDMVKDRAKLTEILLCAVWKRSEFKKEDYLASNVGMEEARRGNLPGFHVLGECSLPEFHREVRVVDFRRVYSLPLPFVRRLATEAGKRIRLLPPYREQLAQAFARYFMRVGLPTDIPSFASSKPDRTEAEVIKKVQAMDKESQKRILLHLKNELGLSTES